MSTTMHTPVTKDRWKVSWLTVGVLAVVITFADGFWITSLEGAVGAIERTQSPFSAWLRESVIVLPLFTLGVLGALALARRWFGQAKRPAVRLLATIGLLVVATTIVAAAQTSFNAVYDYRIQAQGIVKLHGLHPSAQSADPVAAAAIADSACDAVCAAKRNTVEVHVRSVVMASGILLATNAILVAWVLMLRGGVIWRRRPEQRDAIDDVPPSIAMA